MDCKLRIPKKVHNKYHYFLTKFKELEWSGPAWYEIKTDDDGFPTQWTILHFHPLNLGSHAATEWEAKDLAKILGDTYRKFPKLKKAYTGLIHSHNTMGAFLSGTDTDTLEDMAPDKNFYGSLVVASSGKALHAFGFSWKDQYKCVHTQEIEEENIEIVNTFNVDSEWIAIADKIEKEKPESSKTQMNVFNNTVPNSTTLFNKMRKDRIIAKKTKKEQTKINALIDKNTEGKLSDIDLELELEKMGLDITEIMYLVDDSSMNTEYGYGGYNGYRY
jgi:hypothetical protein